MSDRADEADRNVALARAANEAFRRGDVEAFLASLDPEVEIFSPPELPNSGSFTGRDGWVEWTSAWFEAWEGFEVEIERYEAVGQRHVLMAALQRGTGAGSGVPVEMRIFYLAEYRDGLATRFHLYPTREQALAAVRDAEPEAEDPLGQADSGRSGAGR
jgi:ketosteroid isomerase-like protein